MKKILCSIVLSIVCSFVFADERKDFEDGAIYVMAVTPVIVLSVASLAGEEKADEYAVLTVVSELFIAFVYDLITE